ncbi:ISL3 family transposase [Bacterioplanoides sp.]|uniref:ISL3 family transposase n=1 Tax=Bacterioplanoides sp. TaxID=2066072 RepID=UPI003B5A5E6A
MGLLNLPSISVDSIEEDDLDYRIKASINEPVSRYCTHCFSNNLFGHGGKTQLFMDTPIHGKRVGILLNRRRFRCGDCRKTQFEQSRDLSDAHRATVRLVKYIQDRAIRSTNTSVAEDVGVTEATVRNILKSYIDCLEKKYQFETPRVLGLDEVHLNRRMRLVMTNIEQRTLIDLVKDRKKETVITALTKLKNPEKVQLVTIDMWRPYLDAAALVLPHAIPVIDKFHVVKMANEAVEKARKSLRESLSPKQRKGLMNDRFLLLRRRSALTDQQKFILEGWTLNYPMLGTVYEAKETFYEIYDYQTRQEAELAYDDWKSGIPTGVKCYFGDLVRAMDNWHKEIFNYFDHPVTNALTESINNQIKSIYRQGRGYSFDVLRARALFVEAKHKTTKPSFKSRIPEGFIGMATMNDLQVEQKNYGARIYTN